MLYRHLTRVIISATLLIALSFTQSTAQPRRSSEATIYTLNISRTKLLPSVNLKEVTHLKGDFKIPDLPKVTTYDVGLLVFRVTDAKGNMVYETSCANPLDQHLEFVNHDGQFERTHVKTDSDIVNMRIPFNTAQHKVSMYSVDTNNRLALLTTF